MVSKVSDCTDVSGEIRQDDCIWAFDTEIHKNVMFIYIDICCIYIYIYMHEHFYMCFCIDTYLCLVFGYVCLVFAGQKRAFMGTCRGHRYQL